MSFPRARATAISSGLLVVVGLVGLGFVWANGVTLGGVLAWTVLGLLPAVLVLRAFGGAAPVGAGPAVDSADHETSTSGGRSGRTRDRQR